MRDKSNPSIYVLREAGYSEKQGVKVKLSDGSDWAFNAIARGGQENIMGAVGLTGTVTWPEEPGNPDSFMRSWKFVLR